MPALAITKRYCEMPESLAQQPVTDQAVLQRVERVLAELRRGAAVVVERDDGQGALLQAAEAVSDEGLGALAQLAGSEPLLLLTGRRARALGLAANAGESVVALSLSGRQACRVIELADPTAPEAGQVRRQTLASAPQKLDNAAIELVKLARLLPAALLAPLPAEAGAAEAWADSQDLLLVRASEVAEYRFAAARNLTRVADARVPLEGAENTKVIAFRPEDGGVEHLAIVVGDPNPDQAVMVRLHSECFTGDLLGSLRCDCGDQLRGAIKTLGAVGAGIVLYLNQEGRGIGLVNKLRAYALQDEGADTAEANETLGFDVDERIYLPAAEMLRQLGYHRVRLLTNNPEKVEALSRCGITIEERVAHSFPSNGHNEFYLATKARLGHLF